MTERIDNDGNDRVKLVVVGGTQGGRRPTTPAPRHPERLHGLPERAREQAGAAVVRLVTPGAAAGCVSMHSAGDHPASIDGDGLEPPHPVVVHTADVLPWKPSS
jgi:hypothetical protein